MDIKGRCAISDYSSDIITVVVPTMSKPSQETPPASNTLLLRRQLVELTKRPVEGFSAGTKLQSVHPIVGLVHDSFY